MKYKKNIITFILFFVVAGVAFSQGLTKAQMCEDFVFLYKKLKDLNPRFGVVKKVTGVDILADIKNIGSSMDTVTCNAGFYKVVNQALLACKDPHVSFSRYQYKDIDEESINQAIANTKKAYESSNKGINDENAGIPVFHYKGNYYSIELKESELVKLIPQRAQILKVNNIPVDEYIKKWVLPIYPSPRWDDNHQKYYIYNLILPPYTGLSDKTTITYRHNDETKDVALTRFSYNYSTQYKNGFYSFIVQYFEEDRILYIRLYEMNAGMIEYHKKEIGKYVGKEINKVVIDVRGNGGGSDRVWRNALASVIDKPIEIKQDLCFKDNTETKEFLKKMDGIEFDAKQAENEKLIIGKDTLGSVN